MKHPFPALAAALASALLVVPLAGAASRPVIVMTSPAADGALTEQTVLTAVAPTAYAVAFRGRWADADGIRRWHHLGTDREPADGFAVTWAPRAVLGRTNVFVGARALARGGAVLGGARSVHVVTPTDTAGEPSGGVRAEAQSGGVTTFHVVNTCGAGSCKLTRREASRADGKALGTLPEGAPVDIVCQGQGGAVSAKAGSSRIWDRLTDGSWVSDVYVDTPGTSDYTDGIPRCAPAS